MGEADSPSGDGYKFFDHRKMTSSYQNGSSTKVVFMCLICAVGGGFIFGYSMGVSGVLDGQEGFIKEFCVENGLGSEDECFGKDPLKPPAFIHFATQFTAMLSLGCIFGAIGGAVFNDLFGRRATLLVSALLFSAATVWCGLVESQDLMLYARLLSGLGVGACSTVAPVLITEVSSSAMRGRLASLLPLMICFGLICAAIIAEVFREVPSGWRVCVMLPSLPALLVCLGLLCFPDSPRWLMVSRGWEASEKALVDLRGTHAVQRELNSISDSLREERNSLGWTDFVSLPMMKRICIACALQALLVASGINMIYSYGTNILRDVGIYNETVGLIVIYVINIIGTTAAIVQIDHVGRRPLLMQGAIGMFCGHLGSAITVVVLQLQEEDTTTTVQSNLGAYLFVSFVGVTTLYIASSFGPVAWIYPSEIFPHRARSKAVCLTTLVHWLTIYCSSYSLELIYQLGLASTFFLLSAVAVLAFMFVVYFVPETKGYSLEEIQLLFSTNGPSSSATPNEYPVGALAGVLADPANHLASLKAMYSGGLMNNPRGQGMASPQEKMPLMSADV
mmetsp:Transcript_13681/g.20115  ORF Transcript_13681/g.20115 Transcript_13681/m.20115 type:complete len:563 (-) Transcript_13681:372-2060(-)|eukprot:CAMPEP_0113935012 /NCGR_PEP_ID=MMETSP1339-20121228/2250_1 /TAXON_ID=94617 /ORGANISM="Fibrocapsa japonica" /LENGTH=562 /DNA_ID=CAMNT_0000937025 /DNA_START=23 /DNA_END=1711 /DNA_ORIENTATION=- /assembly_acc=CAM_ASM_000762